MKLSDEAQRIGKHTAIAVQLDNGPWVGLVVSDYDTTFISAEDALRWATRLASSKKRADELAAERMAARVRGKRGWR